MWEIEIIKFIHFLKKRIDMKTALEHPWFSKFGYHNDVDNNITNDKNLIKNSTIKNDFGL